MKCSFTRLLYPKTLEESQNGSYTIALFRPREAVLDGDGQKIASFKAVGYYLPLSEKVTVDMAGHWRKDPKYGLQFEMESYEEVVESGRKGMIAYLSSGLIKGIGPKLAGRICDTFGEDTLDILDRDPTRINEVPGVGAGKCARFAKAYSETRGARKIINLLAPLDVSAAQSIHLWKELGLDAEGILRRQPYDVFEQDLISFDLAERLALYQDHVYRPVFADAEQGTAAYIQEMLSRTQLPYMGDLDEELDRQEELLGLTLAEEQKHAVKTALAYPLSIITGGPGTGKARSRRRS